MKPGERKFVPCGASVYTGSETNFLTRVSCGICRQLGNFWVSLLRNEGESRCLHETAQKIRFTDNAKTSTFNIQCSIFDIGLPLLE